MRSDKFLFKKKILSLMIIVIALAVFSGSVSALNIGISPGKVYFSNVLREGYSERIVTVSTDTEDTLFASLKMQGNTQDWIKLEPNATRFNLSRNRPYKLKIIVQPPSDVRTGNYTGSIEFITESVGDISGRAGAMIKTAVTLSLNTEVTGNEIIKCRAGGFVFSDAEIGQPLEISALVFNDGNVRLAPRISIDVWDQEQAQLLLTRELTGDETLPTTEARTRRSIPNSLKEGLYWANMKIPECNAESTTTFSVVEKGGIADKGDLVELMNKPWAYTNETVQIIAKFQNIGSRSVSAKFKGAIRLEDKIVRIVETDEIIVPAGEAADFDIFFTPENPGRYTLSGRVVYNKKLTFEKGTVLNVNAAQKDAAAKKFSYLPFLIFTAIIMTILILIRKIVKEKKRKYAVETKNKIRK